MIKDTGKTFRDHISTTDDEGRRSWVYAKSPKGKLYFYRTLVSILLLLVFFTGPFINIDGQPLLMLNIFERRFVILGKVFWPQDFHLFVMAMITFIVAIVLFTVIYGRIWCGWACPQTVFMEMLFRRIEFWIEGDVNKQKKFDSGEFVYEAFVRKFAKHLVYSFLSLLIVHFFVMYIVGVERVRILISNKPADNFSAFGIVMILSFLFYFVFARFREQVCTLVCPYGRLQGVLLDSNSLVVAYDFRRGENRAHLKKGIDRKKSGQGDCIDCGNCVRVCPTGIDIRNGTQLECINCTACIDECNAVMKKLAFNPGLIRVASYNSISEGKPFRFNARIIAYTSLLFVLVSVLVILFALRKETEATILRVPGSLYQDMGEEISNLYNVKIINKSNKDLPFEIKPISVKGKVQIIGKPIVLKSQKVTEAVFLLYLNKAEINASKIQITLGIYSLGELLEKEQATFIGP